jgi:hypothetical protein
MVDRRVLVVICLIMALCLPLLASAQEGGGFNIPQEVEPDSSDYNCAVPLMSLEGQIMVASGLVGGIAPLSTIGLPVVNPPDIALGQDPEMYHALLEEMGFLVLGQEPGALQEVNVLVVDFFDDPLAAPINVSHGELVAAQARMVADGFGVYIQIIPVPIRIGESSDEIADEINANLEELGEVPTVVNMSFGLVPCSVVDETTYAANAAEYGDFMEQILGTSIAVSPSDSIALLVDRYGCAGDANTVFVAAAGNSGLSYSFAPARLDGVISVGAYEVVSGTWQVTQAGYSNQGVDVWDVGGWYTTPLVPGYGIRGTSFAAPTYSVRLAVLGAATSSGENLCERAGRFQSYNQEGEFYLSEE